MTQWGLDTLFNPAKRHMDEEKRRLQSTREQLGDSSGGRRVDLESGKVVIRRKSVPAAAEPTADGAPTDGEGDPTDDAAGEQATQGSTGAPTAAAADGPIPEPVPGD